MPTGRTPDPQRPDKTHELLQDDLQNANVDGQEIEMAIGAGPKPEAPAQGGGSDW